jgi:cell division control protein 6
MGEKSVFDSQTNIITDAVVFEEDYTPDEIYCRDEMKTEYVQILRPIYKGRPPKNAFLYGDTGVGKTAVTKFLLEKLADDLEKKHGEQTITANNLSILSSEFPEPHTVASGENADLTVVQLNCQNLPTKGEKGTSYQVAVALVNQFLSEEDELSTTGHAPQAIYNRLYKEIDRLGGTILIILDEVDAIGDDDTVLYELPRSRADGKISEARIGVIGISNDYTFQQNLSPKVQDSLCEREIRFPAYGADQLATILRERADVGLIEGSYSESSLAIIAALARRDSSGSARKAIDILQKAAEIAEDRGKEEITEAFAREAFEEIRKDELIEDIKQQDAHKLNALNALAEAHRLDKVPIRKKTLHSTYSKIVEDNGNKPIAVRSFHNHLNRLVMFGLVNEVTENRGKGGGRYNVYELSQEMTPQAVNKAINETDDISWVDVTYIKDV